MRFALRPSRSLVAFVIASTLLANIAGAHRTDGAQYRRRKTLGFGPAHPHARFEMDPVQSQGLFDSSSDPFVVARHFVDSLLMGSKHVAEYSSYFVRKDSYTDENTGVSHVYFRQVVDGMEVVDGDINVNVFNGRVLSYGYSFYDGATVPHLPFDTSTPLMGEEHCDKLTSQWIQHHEEGDSAEVMQLLYPSSQTVLGSQDSHVNVHVPHTDAYLHSSYCLPNEIDDIVVKHVRESPTGSVSPVHAALSFMVAATDKEELAQDILARYDHYYGQVDTVMDANIAPDTPNAFQFHLHNVPDTVNPVKAKMAYIQVPSDGEVKLLWVYKMEVEMQDNWYEAAITALPPYRIVSVVDWASDAVAPIPKEPKEKPVAVYNVFSWGINDPESGNRTIEEENFDSLASPLGWHSIPTQNDPWARGKRFKGGNHISNHTTTWGNNVFAHENWAGRNDWELNYRPDAGEDLVFDYQYAPVTSDDSLGEAKKYINATITQLFYTSNLIHDLYYRYGFDERSGNFQQHNFGRGGEENDAVIANAQDGSGYNNANFMTPPDGQNGRCRMYLWNTAEPYRDGDLEAGIVIHELTHGLSTRLTGGPANSGCLGWGESGGMGEGWGDFLATTIRSNRNYSDYAMGAWAANREGGIRNYIYSLNETVNPSTYKTLDKPGYWGVHAIGEVWAEMLWIVSQRLIAKHGYIEDLFPPAPLENGTVPEGDFYRPAQYLRNGQKKPSVPKHGNSLMVQLVLNGMKLQPCRPSFFDARDAIIQADEVLTGGENFCELWIGFSERGLGVDSVVEGRTPWGGGIRTNGYAVPRACKELKTPKDPKPAPGDEDDDDWVYLF